MSSFIRRFSMLLGSIGVAVLLASCGDHARVAPVVGLQPGGPSLGYAPPHGCDNLTPASTCTGSITTNTVLWEQLRVCKVYPGGTGPDVEVKLNADYVMFQDGPQSGTYTLQAGQCLTLWRNGEEKNGVRSTDVITVSETPVSGYTTTSQVTTIIRDQADPGPNSTFTTTVGPVTTATSVTSNIGGARIPGALVVFTNTAIPNGHPTPIANGPYFGVEGSSVTFNSAGTADPEGDPLTYLWTFGDGVTSTTQNPTHTYSDNGVYPVTLSVDDGHGPVTVNTTATITNANPVPTASVANASVTCGQLASFTGTFTDAGIIDQTWTWSIGWGDGSPVTTGSNALMATPITAAHNYATNAGTFSITLTVTDKDGGIGSATTSEVNSCRPNRPPVPIANGPYFGVEGSLVSFNSTGTGDPDGDVLTYSWNFGDGSPSATGSNPTHTYKDNGVVPVTLTVDDGHGHAATVNTTATITNVAPVPTLTTSTANVSCNQLGSVIGVFSDAGVLDMVWSYDIDWGDGSAHSLGTTMTQSGTIPATHAYAANGVYTVMLRVIDKDGGVGTSTTSITMNCIKAPSCTLTQGYWKNHESAWPAPYSPTAQWLNATHKVNGVTWEDLMGMSVAGGNSYMQLAHQWIAASLNLAGATSSNAAVASAMSQGGAWLLANTPAITNAVPNMKNAQATAWASTLDDFNNGKLGTPHCN